MSAVSERARQVAFLHKMTYAVEHDPHVGRYRVSFERDGTEHHVYITELELRRVRAPSERIRRLLMDAAAALEERLASSRLLAEPGG